MATGKGAFMRKRAFSLVAVALSLSTIAGARLGGWAVVSAKDAPDHFVVDKPATFDFIVRQHGETPMDGLRPAISARKGVRWVNGKVVPTPAAGVYRATIAVPSTGDWNVTIESGFGPAKGRLGSIRAIAATEKAPAYTPVEKGRMLFASAGCVTCHVHGGVDMKPLWDFRAPELTDKRFAADYLAKFLADPTIQPRTTNGMQMPNPHLRPSEITALVAFINDERKVAAK
jgi:mono/diheme cytochrome c family protein